MVDDFNRIEEQIEFRLSGGETNTNPFLSLGSFMSNDIVNGGIIVDGVMDNVWDDLSAAERLGGDTSYRWIYLFNNSIETLRTPHMYFTPADPFVRAMFIIKGVNQIPDLLPDEHTAPPSDEIGVVTTFPTPFLTGESYETTSAVGPDLTPGQFIAICLKRVIPINTDPSLKAQYRLVIESRP